MVLLDTSGLLAALSPDQTHHRPARAALAAETPPCVLSPFVLAELDYLTRTRGSVRAELALLDQVASEAYELAPFGAEDVAEAANVIHRYRDLELDLADASTVVLAARYGTQRILTLDERHFRALQARDGRPFVLLPADA